MAIVIVAWAEVTGCGNGMSGVYGTVTLDDEPVEGSPNLYGTVSFHPDGGNGAPAVGIIQESGEYTVMTGSQPGMAPGNYSVAVSVKRIHPPAEPGGLTRPERISPSKYANPKQSGFRAEVQPGSNSFDFALVSDGDN